MPGVIGANANLYLRPETSYGTLATGNYTRLGFLRAGLGVSQQLLDLRVLGIGQGRDAGDPMQGEIDTEGEVEIPLNQDGLGHWLRLLLGPPTTTGTSPNFVHAFASGAAALPSASLVLDYGATLTDRYLVLTGVRAGNMAIGFGPTGPATARIGLMAQGGGLQPTAVHGTPVTVTGANFLRPQGRILKGATPLALVTDANLDVSNGLEALRTIRNDRRIEEAEPGGTSITGRVTARLAAGGLLAEALADTPVDLTLGFEASAARAVEFRLPRTFLSRPRAEIEGPGGVSVTTTCAPRPMGSAPRSPSRCATALRATHDHPRPLPPNPAGSTCRAGFPCDVLNDDFRPRSGARTSDPRRRTAGTGRH